MKPVSSFDVLAWAFVFFFLALGVVTFRQSWINLVKHQWADFSWDNLSFMLSSTFRGWEAAMRARKLAIEDPKRIRVLGIWALVRAFIAVGIAVYLYVEFLK